MPVSKKIHQINIEAASCSDDEIMMDTDNGTTATAKTDSLLQTTDTDAATDAAITNSSNY